MRVYGFLRYVSVRGIGLDTTKKLYSTLSDVLRNESYTFKTCADLYNIEWKTTDLDYDELQTLIIEKKLALFPFSKTIPTYKVLTFISKGFNPVFCKQKDFNYFKKELSTLE